MITRVFFLKARQRNRDGGTCHAFRCTPYVSWFAPDMAKVAQDFFDDISAANNLPEDGWILESFSQIK